MPAASFAFEPGQWATATSWRARIAMSSSESWIACAASTRPPSEPVASSIAGTEPNSARTASSSPSASATWRCISAPRSRASAAVVTIASVGSVYAACGP